MARIVAIALFSVFLLAGCGGKSLYSMDKTRSCLSSEDARIGDKVDFVASTAKGGAFVANLSDNSVTVAFGAKEDDAAGITVAYQRFAFPNVKNNIQDVLQRYQNAVLLWHVHPQSADLALVTGCLK